LWLFSVSNRTDNVATEVSVKDGLLLYGGGTLQKGQDVVLTSELEQEDLQAVLTSFNTSEVPFWRQRGFALNSRRFVWQAYFRTPDGEKVRVYLSQLRQGRISISLCGSGDSDDESEEEDE
jgi:hypothetical protein